MALIASTIRKTGDTSVVTIPAEEMHARGLLPLSFIEGWAQLMPRG